MTCTSTYLCEMLKSFFLVICAFGYAGANIPGCAEDLPVTGERHPCGYESITQSQCAQLGCCWQSGRCLAFKEQFPIAQGSVRPRDTPVRTHAGFSVEKCSSEAFNIANSWDWAFSMDTSGMCRIYSSRWHIYRQQGTLVTNADYTSYEQLTWDKRPRDEYENFGTKELVLENLYMGCYSVMDSSEGNEEPVEDIEVRIWSWDKNTASDCLRACRSEGYLVAGLRNNLCYCSNRLLRNMDPVSDSICNVRCPGNDRQNCGSSGNDYNAVYFVPQSSHFAGCYNDTANIHQWEEWKSRDGRSSEECIDQCSKREDISNRKYYHHYAIVANNGDCYCADQKTLVENALLVNPVECMGRCSSLEASQPDQYCGNPGIAAVYETHHNFPQRPSWSHTPFDWHHPMIRRMRFREADNVPITDSTVTGIPLNLFTQFPELQTILTPRLILHATDKVVAPFEELRCGSDCWSRCGKIWFEDRIVDGRQIVKIRDWYLNLKEIFSRIGEGVSTVYVYAQTVVIDDNFDFPFSLVVRARNIIIDRSTAHYLTVSRDAPVLVNDYFDDNDVSPAADELFIKQTVGCAKILMQYGDQDEITTAFEMFDDIVEDHEYDKEQSALQVAAQLTRSQFTGLVRSDIRYVPFFTKSYFRGRLQIQYTRLDEWVALYQKVLDTSLAIDKFLGFTQEMLDIFVTTNIGQWQMMYEAQMVALKISNSTYHAVYNNFSISRDQMEEAQVAFEQGLQKYQNQQRRKGVLGFIKGFAKVCVGIVTQNWKQVFDGLKDWVTTLKNLQETMEFMARAMEKVEAMMVKMVYLLEMMDDIIENGDLHELASDVEMIAQLNVMLVGWENMKYNTREVLSHPDIQPIEGSGDYLTTTVNTCNWGYALTETMIEMAENYRRLMLIKSMLQAKIEMQQRYTEYIDDCKADNSKRYDLLQAMIEMQEDLRIDINELLSDYCSLHYYENQRECSVASQPRFDGSMQELKGQLLSALEDSMWGTGVPGSTCRPISIKDTNFDPDCTDITECPIKMFRETRMLRFNIPEDFYEFNDIDKYRIGEIFIDVPGAKRVGGPDSRLKFLIESSAPFGVRLNNQWSYFVTRALRVVHEYDIDTGAITWRAQLYRDEESNIYHRSPFTTWVMSVDPRSDHINIDDVTQVDIVFDGSGSPALVHENNFKTEDLRCSKAYQRKEMTSV